MIVTVVVNIIRILVFILLQVTIIKQLDLGSYLNPFLYVICILALPINMNKGWVMFIAFFVGLIIDMFYNTMGMNAAASVFIAYCRPAVLRIYAPQGGYEPTANPTIQSLGLNWTISYYGTLALLHHLLLFFLEALTFSYFFETLAKAIVSSAATTVLILISLLLMQKNPLK
ncbi:MAG: hypothetical protein HKL88_10170 [Bacteroidia bacterium]|jgi:rod shape-determining protein MreD|nr:hypothetical protein [Bacteroidia bacterium]